MILATSSGVPRRCRGIWLRYDVFGAGREDRGIDLARRDGVDTDTERTEVRRHFARERRQRCFRRGIGRTRERMHARAGNRGHVDDRPLCRLELFQQPAGERDRREEVHAKDLVPDIDRGVDRGQARTAVRFGRDRGIVDQGMQFAVLEPLLDLGDRRERAGGIGKVDLDVILRPHLPGAVLGEWVARAGDDAPTGRGKSLHRGMADAAARSRQQESAARLVRLRRHHEVKSQNTGTC